jgi:hypothetical protein
VLASFGIRVSETDARGQNGRFKREGKKKGQKGICFAALDWVGWQ